MPPSVRDSRVPAHRPDDVCRAQRCTVRRWSSPRDRSPSSPAAAAGSGWRWPSGSPPPGWTSCSPTCRTTPWRRPPSRSARAGVDVLTVRTDVSKEADVQALAAADARALRRRPRRLQQRRRGASVRPVVRAAHVVGVGDGRQLLGRRARLPRLPPPPRRRRAHRQHGVDRRADAGVRAELRRVQARRRGDQRGPLHHGATSPACRSGSACCARAGCARTSSRPTATGRPSSARSRPTTRPTRRSGEHVERALAEGRTPASVADAVVEAIVADRFWVIPHQDFLDIVDRPLGHASPSGPTPNRPSTCRACRRSSQIVAEVIAAMARRTA